MRPMAVLALILGAGLLAPFGTGLLADRMNRTDRDEQTPILPDAPDAPEARETPEAAASPVPSGTPGTPHLIVALETEQGKASERTALFDDGTLAHVTRWSGRSVINRKKLSSEEIAIIRQVCLDALPSDEESRHRQTVLVDENVRRIELELVDEKGKSHRFAFDDFTQLSLSLGRARGAIEDLRARFLVKDVPKEQQWNPATLKEGDVLVRRSDSTRFTIVRDDAYEQNLELRSLESTTLMLFLSRAEVPKMFEEPPARRKGGKDNR
ncbi:MAG: hypothetical protein ABIT01_13825 [Thermoanaerobaculia bacterium]